MSPALHALATRYASLVRDRDAEPWEEGVGGGRRLSLRGASLGIEATKVAHELAAMVAAEVEA